MTPRYFTRYVGSQVNGQLLFENLQIIYKRNEYLDIVMETVRKFLLFKGRAQHDS